MTTVPQQEGCTQSLSLALLLLLSATTPCPNVTGERSTLSSGKLSGKVLLGGQERNVEKFRQLCAHVKQVRAMDTTDCMDTAGA